MPLLHKYVGLCNKKIPVIIHCRDAFDETVAALKSLSSLSLTGVFHSFGGLPDQVKIIRELGDFLFRYQWCGDF